MTSPNKLQFGAQQTLSLGKRRELAPARNGTHYGRTIGNFVPEHVYVGVSIFVEKCNTSLATAKENTKKHAKLTTKTEYHTQAFLSRRSVPHGS